MSMTSEEQSRVVAHAEAQERIRRFAASPGVVAAAKQSAEMNERLRSFAVSPGVVAAAKQSAEMNERLRSFAVSPGVVAAAKQSAEMNERLRSFAVSPGVVAAAKQSAEMNERLRSFAVSPGFVAAAKQAAEMGERIRRFAVSPGVVAAAKQSAEMNERLRSFAASPGVVAAAKQAAEMGERIRRFAVSPGVVAAAKQSAEMNERLRSFAVSPGFVAAAKQAAEVAARMQHWLREWDEGERRFIDLLAPRGWMISPRTSLTEVHELLALAESEGIDAVEQAIVDALTTDRCREIVEGLYDRPSFATWRDVFEQALSAHERGDYALCVPIWLLTFDGIWLAEFGVENIFTRIRRKRGSVVRRAFPHARTRILDALILVMSTVSESLAPGASPMTDGLRRHVVLHGLDPCYGTKKASVQGILMLEALHAQLEQNRTPLD